MEECAVSLLLDVSSWGDVSLSFCSLCAWSVAACDSWGDDLGAWLLAPSFCTSSGVGDDLLKEVWELPPSAALLTLSS